MEDVIASLTRINTLPLYSHITKIDSPTAWTLDIHLSQPDRWLPWLLGQVPAMILPREWETLANFASHPIGTGPYAVRRNTPNQLKILAFDDYFGYRALIDEVNVWVLPDISEEPACGLMLEGPIQGGEKAIESRLEEGCYYLLFDARTPRGAHPQVREWVSHVLSPPIYSIMPMNRYSSSGSRPMGFTALAPRPSRPGRKTRRAGNPHADLLSRTH